MAGAFRGKGYATSEFAAVSGAQISVGRHLQGHRLCNIRIGRRFQAHTSELAGTFKSKGYATSELAGISGA